MRPVNAQALSRAFTRPGIDPRAWNCTGRIGEESAYWDASAGWIVDVDVYGGPLDGNAGMVCRVSSLSTGSGYGVFLPPLSSAEVIVQITDGEPDANPVVIGTLSNQDDMVAPTSVCSLPIDPLGDSSTLVSVSPYDTEIWKSPHNFRGEWEGGYHATAKEIILEGGTIKLGTLAISPVAKGDTLKEALLLYIDSVADVTAFSFGVMDPSGASLSKFQAVMIQVKLLFELMLSQKTLTE